MGIKDKPKDPYARPGWNFSIKKRYAEHKIKKIQKEDTRHLTRYDDESPKSLTNEKNSDNQVICGYDSIGNSLYLEFSRRRHSKAEIWLVIRLANGEVFTLPDHPNTKVANATPGIFEGAGLKLECLLPYSKWRVTYSGLLRKGVEQNVSANEDNLFFVRFNFIWTTASNPRFWPLNGSHKLIANSLATEHWESNGKFMELLKKKESGGYDQFGACQGLVKVYEKNFSAYVKGMSPKGETFEMNLPGIRQRRYGSDISNKMRRIVVLFASAKDGCVFEVGALSEKRGLTHTQFGNFRFPDTRVCPIDWTDLHLASLGENQNDLPETTTIQIEADEMKFTIEVTFKIQEKIPLFGGHEKENWNAFIIPIEITMNKNVLGKGSATFWYSQSAKDFNVEEVPTKIQRIFNCEDVPSPSKLLVSFSEKEAQSVSISGGKGSSVAILREIQDLIDDPEYFMPQGFNVSVSAIEEHLKNNPAIRECLLELEDIAYERSKGDIQEACSRVQKSFENTKLAEGLQLQIGVELNKINADGAARFAVRSSGVTEDSEESSAAGQNETFLGLRKNEDVYEAVVKCWASLYTYQSVQYRKQHVQPVVTSMSVVIMKMVTAESAGVLFSRHPLNGDPSVIVITANYGLGESVVSGKSEPDTFFIKRSHKDELEVLGSLAGAKNLLIEMDEDMSIKEIELDEERKNRLCLSEDLVLKLAKLGVIMEKFFGTPRDIEFAVTKDKKIYLLQSRPITALNNFTDYEIIHEFDTPIMSDVDICTKATVGEIILGSATILTTTAIMRNFADIMTKEMGLKGEYSELCSNIFPINRHHLFMNVADAFLNRLGDKIQINDRISTLGYFGADIFEKHEELFEIAHHRNSMRSKEKPKMSSMMYTAMFKTTKLVEDMDLICKRAEKKFSRENLEKVKSSKEVFRLFEAGIEEVRIVSYRHTLASVKSSVYSTFSFLAIAQNAEKLSADHQADIATILGSIGEVESANVPKSIKEITDQIVSQNKRDEFMEVDRMEAIEWLRTNCEKAYELFNVFIKRNGHRALNEYDLSTITWGMEPEKIIDMIKSNLVISTPVSSKAAPSKAKTTEEIIESLKTPMGSKSRFTLRRSLPRYKVSIQEREHAKGRMIFVINIVRQIVIYLGEQMVRDGLLPEKDLIFHLSLSEIKDLIATRDGKFVMKAIKRQKHFPKLNELKFDEISYGVPRPLSEKDNSQLEAYEGDILAKGSPVCGGLVTAKACVCKSFADVVNLEKGDILITYGTDIGWSPYFPILGGICTEIGGLMTHGAVVAREYGLPCIVGATSATDRIKHGQMITLNADEGKITTVE